ncbi:MAG: hypothetical protein D6786_05635 [Gammaproteobacteria bacterium]|nr:MAG: hypothetical protein D6786_05635 [Gammaproteobacteria bacterium]
MSEALLQFINHHREPLLALYVAALVLTVAAFTMAVWRGSRELGRESGRGAGLAWRGRLPPVAAISMGSLFLLLILPWFVDNLGRYGAAWRENPALPVLMLMFAGAGLLLLGLGFHDWRSARGGGRELKLGAVDLRPGGLVSGSYGVQGQLGDGTPVRVHLVLQQSRLLRLGRERHLLERALWSSIQEVRPRRRGEGVEIPFLFRLPARLPDLEEGSGRPEWILVREGGGIGSGIHLVGAGADTVSAWRDRRADREPSPPVSPMPSASLRAGYQVQRVPLADLAALGFVALFPWVFWFLMDSARKPWLHLREQLPPLLLAGAITLCLFFTAVFALLNWALGNQEEGRRWRRLLRLSLAGDAVILTGAIFWLARHGLHRPMHGWFDAVAVFLLESLPHAFVGMFLWISIFALIQMLRRLGRSLVGR